MGFYLRKSVRAGPFRFNLSGSGIGVSVGVPGLRVGTGPRGNYVQMGMSGVHYRASLGGAQTQPRATPPPLPSASPHESVPDGMRPVAMGNVLSMAPSSSADLLREIREKHQRMSWCRFAAAGTAVMVFVCSLLGASTLALAFLVAGCVTMPLGWYFDQIDKTVVLFYQLDADAEARYQELHTALAGLRSAQRTWYIWAQGSVTDWKRNAGASSLVTRNPAALSVAAPAHISTNIAVPALTIGSRRLYFFPDRILVYNGADVGAVEYDELLVSASTSRFIEEGGVPSDARVVDHTWKYVRKDGGPDRRFNDNRQLPVCLYDQARLTSGSGLNVILDISRPGTAAPLQSALQRQKRIASAPARLNLV